MNKTQLKAVAKAHALMVKAADILNELSGALQEKHGEMPEETERQEERKAEAGEHIEAVDGLQDTATQAHEELEAFLAEHDYDGEIAAAENYF